MTAASGVRLDRDGLVTVLTIDRPEARNAIARATMQELAGALDDVEASPARVLVVTGAGTRVFVAGGDLKELAAIRTHEDATAMAETMRGVLDRLATLPIPVVAAVNGDAYGGGAEVAVACDIRIAADDVQCAFNQVALGIMPAWGGIERLTALRGSRTGSGPHDDRARARRRGRTRAGTVRRSGAAHGVRQPLA